MEHSVDRSDYRRTSRYEEKEVVDEKKYIYKVLKKLCVQSIAAVIVLCVAYMAKIFKMDVVTGWIEAELSKNIPIEMIYEEGKMLISDLCAQLYSNDDTIPTTAEDNFNEASNYVKEELEPILSISTDVSTEPIYEIAVEGVNQLESDATYVKENYKLIYPLPFKAEVTSIFGVRTSDNPIVTSYHSGIDLAANSGTKIKAALGGKVIKAATDNAYGKYIMIETGDLITVYAHCSQIYVKVNQMIKQGDIIGAVGSTGWATGPHLHFEIRYSGRIVNPADVLDFWE